MFTYYLTQLRCNLLKTMISTSCTSFRSRQYLTKADLRDQLVGYCTDIEGNLDYWKRYVNMSRVLARTSNGIILKENCHFVYGGDVCDRGPGDIRVLEDIVKLKRDNPDNVHIILGNRDINKMRLLTELLPEFTCKPSRTYWTGDIDDKGEHNAVNRLKAILIDTMGAPDTFEHRRQELKDLGRDSSDEAVVQSFWDLLKPEGLLTEYLKQGTLAVLLGDTLFLHGGLHSNSLGWIPPSRDLPPGDSGHHVDNVATWCEQLEAFRAAEMKDFVEFSQWLQLSSGQASERRLPFTSHWSAEGGYNHPTPGSRLLQYGMGWMPDKSVNPTLVYDNFLSDGAPMPPSSEIASKLRRNGVRRVIAGHQPHGDAPVVIDSFGLQVRIILVILRMCVSCILICCRLSPATPLMLITSSGLDRMLPMSIGKESQSCSNNSPIMVIAKWAPTRIHVILGGMLFPR